MARYVEVEILQDPANLPNGMAGSHHIYRIPEVWLGHPNVPAGVLDTGAIVRVALTRLTYFARILRDVPTPADGAPLVMRWASELEKKRFKSAVFADFNI